MLARAVLAPKTEMLLELEVENVQCRSNGVSLDLQICLDITILTFFILGATKVVPIKDPLVLEDFFQRVDRVIVCSFDPLRSFCLDIEFV